MNETRSEPLSRTGPHDSEILEAAAEFYRETLWGLARTDVTRSFLRRRGLSEEILRQFGVGYAPIGWTTLSDELRRLGFSRAEIVVAGLATRSHRRGDRFYDLFRSRIMFPIREHDGELIGFAALATHPGPSWPRWLTPPDGPRFRAASAIFGLDRATAALRDGEPALISRDCVETLLSHQRGERNAVAVIRSRVTAAHRKKLTALGAPGGADASRPAPRGDSALALPAR